MKTRIIQAFIEETRNNGIKFTMDDLAKRLGISKRTLYENFSSKVDILDSIIDFTLSEFDEQTRLIIDNPEFTLAEKIKKAIVVLPKYNEFYDLRILEQLKRSYPAQWERVNRELNQWDDLKALLEEGIKTGIIKNMNIDLLMKLIIETANITLDRQFFLQHSISISESLETIVDALLNGIMTEKNDECTGT
ncbi:TetR/AcrR family transcriptional regulator [Lysinibacillus sp. NPDC096418]|uniref:TetR/AcrR family transcriptional regulator n=1 Tax=Lysinibacillus sp. NPDC096418 TaxID=3364138 RepID=UPI0037F2CDDF